MNANWSCPKCKCREALHVLGSKGQHGGIPVTRFVRGNLRPSSYVCASCGFVEQYFEIAEHREALAKKYGKAASAAKRRR